MVFLPLNPWEKPDQNYISPTHGDALKWHSSSPSTLHLLPPLGLCSPGRATTSVPGPHRPQGPLRASAGHSCPERTDFCFHKHQCATVVPGLLTDGQFRVLPRKEAENLLPKYQGSDRLHKGSLIYLLLYYKQFSSTIVAQMRKEGKEGHYGLVQQLNATSSFLPVIHIQSVYHTFKLFRVFGKARKQPLLVTASHS